MTLRRMTTKKFYGRAARGRRRQPSEGMNRTEAKYAGELEVRRLAGEIWAWWFEPLKLRLADKTYYTPDFLVQHADDRLEFVEIKGHWEDDARVKWKTAAELCPWAWFTAITVSRGGRKIERLNDDAAAV